MIGLGSCIDLIILMVKSIQFRSAKQDARISEPETIDASPLLGKQIGPKLLNVHAMVKALMPSQNDKTWSAVFKMLSLTAASFIDNIWP